MNQPKTYVLYHHPCPDGCASAAIAAIALRERIHPASPEPIFIGVNYGVSPPYMEDGSNVYILDFSYPRDVLINLNSRMNRLLVLDHHKTAKVNCDGLAFCVFDMKVSGAILTWEHFFNEQVAPKFVQYVCDRDLWQFKLPESREFSAGLRSHPFDFNLFATFIAMGNDGVDALKREGKVALRMIDSSVNSMCKNTRWGLFDIESKQITLSDQPINPHTSTAKNAPVVNASVFFSEVGERLLELNTNVEFSAYYFDRADMRQWGIRARSGFDATPIALAFGGGGHPQACGFTTPL